MAFDEQYDFRNRLVRAVIRDLMGPSGSDPADEVIPDPPITHYIVGILFPRDAGKVDPDQHDDTAEGGDETSHADPAVAMANVRYPSSMGMTFSVDTHAAPTVRVRTVAAAYEPFTPAGETDEQWRRVPVECRPVEIDVTVPDPGSQHPVADGLELFCRVREANDEGVAPVTVALLNVKRRPGSGLRDAAAFFQPRLHVTAPGSGRGAFVARPSGMWAGSDEDVRSNRLLYRHQAAIAVGHGCSVEWESDPQELRRALTVSTTFVPQYELLLSDSNPAIDTAELTMRRMAQGGRDSVLASIDKLIEGYRKWVEALATQVNELDDEFSSTAEKHVEACKEALDRIGKGRASLLEDDVWEAFRRANLAMLRQRARTVWLRSGRPESGPVESDDHRWRPFQLAFILLCIESISNPDSDHRDTADLLWFPTGGGKTEAYLGLIAFTIFLRRLRHPTGGDGVTAIMRYTLRLLTIQQFERASLLICCCESVRLEREGPGGTAISIALWVGKGGTPNTLREARVALDKLRQGHSISVDESNPMQLQACPWCGTVLTPNHYYITRQNPQLVINCKAEGCLFRNGLPVYVVDQDVYRKRPTLLIATADKFAALPWREQAASIFNRVTGDSLPPELIIQDELHLISGPLGTLAGLYETAIDLLCSSGGIRPKVIASTATIRRADSQTRALFERKVRQFPPPGLDARDSYFAVETDRDSRGARLYAGVMAPGTSHSTLMIRTYAALLQNAAALTGPAEIRDAYWTLIGYFNSLRVLGGARMQVQDDINERIALLAGLSGRPKRAIDNRIELTSREPSGDIPVHLQRMAVPLPDADALDVILATNMISVGMDVDRLGLMVVMGQPQLTSEYIQATSRVGRRTPGLIFTLFNAGRSRDRSHYESFVDYHSALYRQVESTSVTPFSARARDRGLHAVFIALARLMVPELRPNDSASRVAELVGKLEPIKQAILNRVAAVDTREVGAAKAQLDQILDDWLSRACEQPDLVFMDYQRPDRALLVDMADVEQHVEGSFPTLWSLRDVDMSSGLYLVR